MEDLERELVDWLVDAGLDNGDEQALVDGFCARLNAAGFELLRAFVASEILHPLHDARGFVWRGRGVAREHYGYTESPEQEVDWQKSPLRHLVENGLPSLHLRLDDGLEPGRFPLLHRLRDEGGTDYLAQTRPFGSGSSFGDRHGIVASWTTRRPEGFSNAQIALLERCIAPLALACKAISTFDTGRTLMRIYLGHDAGERVIAGEIRRGEPQAIDAVLWSSDLMGFTRLADTVEPKRLMGLLNDYAEQLVSAVEEHGGDVLKFMGDGILALFRGDDACAQALKAAMAARAAVEQLNAGRAAQLLPVTDFYLGLHRGTVLYGNIGSRERLDFTVIGPAVNEVARIEQMCRSLDQKVVISAAFAAACGSEREKLVSLGRYALRGVGRAQELFTIDPERLPGGA
jgi:adenylate cyclase